MALTFLTLATLPAASAGPGASADTLAGDGTRCSRDAYSWSDNSSYWYSYGSYQSEACSDRYDYATVEAHDDDGEVASASLSARHDNASSGGYGQSGSWTGDQSSWGSSWFGRGEDAWSRDADVSTRAGGAGTSYGCARADSSNHSSYSSYGSHGDWGYDAYHSSYSDRCGLTTSAPGEEAFVGSDCQSTDADVGSYNSWGDWYYWQDETRGGSSCATGVQGDAASAGWTTGCGHRGYQRGEYEWSGNASRSWSTHEAECADGLTVVGPDGATLFADAQSWTRDDCEDDACSTASERAAVVRLAWEHNPLQPGESILYFPLP